MATHQGAYTPPGGPRKKLASGSHNRGSSQIVMLHGYPYLANEGEILISPEHFHPIFGICPTMDAHWNGSGWKIALAKPAETCPDCHAESCSLCGGHGSILIRSGDTIQDYCARPGPEPGYAERKCPKCLGKKCNTCGDKGEIVPIIWILRTKLRPLGKPETLKPGNTNRAKHVMVGEVETRDHNNRYEQVRAEAASRGI